MMACTSPLFTTRSRPLRICLPSTVTCRFLTSSIGTSLVLTYKLKCEMISAISSFFFGSLSSASPDTTERTAAHVDLALLADHDHHSFRVHALFRLLQQDALAIEHRLHAVILQLLRRREIGVEELLQERARRIAGARAARHRPWRAWPQAPRPPCRAPTSIFPARRRAQPTEPSRLIEISFCASTANSIGSCCSTSLTKPLTTSATASSAERPRWRQ